MTDKNGLIRCEGTRAENVVRVHVRENHVPNRKPGHLPNDLAQFLTVVETAAWIGHGDGLASNDEADVGDRAGVLGGGLLVDAATNVNARRNLRYGDRVRAGTNCKTGNTAEAPAPEQDIASREK